MIDSNCLRVSCSDGCDFEVVGTISEIRSEIESHAHATSGHLLTIEQADESLEVNPNRYWTFECNSPDCSVGESFEREDQATEFSTRHQQLTSHSSGISEQHRRWSMEDLSRLMDVILKRKGDDAVATLSEILTGLHDRDTPVVDILFVIHRAVQQGEIYWAGEGFRLAKSPMTA